MRRPLGFLIAIISAVPLAACGVPSEGEFSPIQEKDLPFNLGVVPTTTATTPVSQPESGSAVQLYFVTGTSIIRETRFIDEEPSPDAVLRRLVIGPLETSDLGLVRSALPRGLSLDATVEKGVASINTTSGLLTEVPPYDQTLAVAQIVLALTSLPGIGQVTFSINGRPIAVPRGGGDLTSPGAEVSFDDYASLLIN